MFSTGCGFVDSKDVIFTTGHRHTDRLHPSGRPKTSSSDKSSAKSRPHFRIEIREDKPIPIGEHAPDSELDEPMLQFVTQDADSGRGDQTSRRYSRMASASTSSNRSGDSRNKTTSHGATVAKGNAIPFLSGGQPAEQQAKRPAIGELLGTTSVALPPVTLENPFAASTRWLNVHKPNSTEVLGQVLVEIEVEYQPEQRVDSLDIDDDKQLLLLAARHFVGRRGIKDSRRLIEWIDKQRISLLRHAEKYKQLSAFYAAKFSSLEDRAAMSVDVSDLDTDDYFRSSVRKADEVLDAIPINLHIHSLHCVTPGSGGDSSGNQREAVREIETETMTSDSFHVISMGAPAAHAMKFKGGLGLGELYAKLEEAHKNSIVKESKAASPGHGVDDSRSSLAGDTEVRFGIPAQSVYDDKFIKRQDMCLSQALCAVTAAFMTSYREALVARPTDSLVRSVPHMNSPLFV